MITKELFTPGSFFTGCNYWASHAGTNMWHDWNEEAVESDLARLEQHRIRVIRMFPLWSDFQPLRMHRQWANLERELRLREEPLPFTEAGQAGIDPIMIDRFQRFCDLAQKHGLQLIVGLITGWMSGRMHAPEAFEGRNLITDPLVVRWQIRFVRYMVKHFKSHPAIVAWDLGNECDCLQDGTTADENYVWTAQITNAIKREDPSRPVISGLHGNLPDGRWRPEDLGDQLDVLCTHPYPIFTPHCDTDPIHEMKSVLHATAETEMYASLSGKPAFVEEAGTLGPMISSEQVAGDYIRAAAFSTWIHDLGGFVWWCANEQIALTQTPYDWNSVERELGLFHLDGSPKPVVEALGALTDFVDHFPYGTLPPRIIDGVCILTEGSDTWANAYGTFLMAKQAGLDIRFAWCHDELPQAKTYFLPSMSGSNPIFHHEMKELLARVAQGATLYLSVNDALLSPFSEITGVEVKTRSRRQSADTVQLGDVAYTLWSDFRLELEQKHATVLAKNQKEEPVFTVAPYGKGRICFLAYPIERDAACKGGVISGENAIPLYRFYEAMELRSSEKIAKSNSPTLCITEHVANENLRFLPALNHTPKEDTAQITLQKGWKLKELLSYCGGEAVQTKDGFQIKLPANTGAVAVIEQQ